MNRLLSLVILAAFCCTAWAADDPAPAGQEAAATKSPEDQLKANPDSTAAINQFMLTNLRQLSSLMASDPDQAEEILTSMSDTLNSLEPTTDEAKQLLQRAKDAVGFYNQRLQIAKTSLEDLKAKLNENADDPDTIKMLISKTIQQLGPTANSEPAKAEEQLAVIEKFLEELKSKLTTEEAKTALNNRDRAFSRLRDSIQRAQRLAALIGSEATPLAVEAWVNGDPLTDADLKGKVVLLDFWSVWCGPCIATFPHLRDWHAEYADKGLIIIGLTRYYNYTWDEATGRPKRSREKVPAEQEQDMLLKFAEHHNLQHRFAIQKDSSLSEFYGVTGIPHVVVVDRQGKVQLMRVGSGEENAKAVEAKIEELIAEGA
jgi:thiol-disulfide isomerase/thioredoxin